MIAGLLFVLANTFALGAAWVVSGWVLRDREPVLRALGALAAFPLVVVLALWTANHVTGLDPVAATAVAGAAFAAATLGSRRAARGLRGARDGRRGGPVPRRSAWSLAAGAASAGLLSAWSARTLLGGTRYQWDDLAYHAALPAQWLVDGALSMVPSTFQTYYPLNGELVSLWWLLPFGSDAHAHLAVFLWGALAAASLAVLVRGLGGGAGVPAVAVALFFASRVVWQQAGGFAATDLAATATLLAALALQLPARAGASARAARAAASGALAGFALGCRVFYAPAVLVVGAGAALLPGAHGGWRPRARGLAAFAAGLCATGSYWYARNWLLTGNPVFPADLGPWEGPFDAAARAPTQLIPGIPSDVPPDLWRRVIASRLDWPVSLACAALLGYAAALPAWLQRARGPRERSRRQLRALLWLAGASLLLLHPFLPFSATANRPGAPVHAGYLRFLLLPFAAGVALFAERLAQAAPLRGAWRAAALVAIATAWPLGAASSAVALAAGGIFLTLRRPLARAAGWLVANPRLGLAAAAAGFGLLALATPLQQSRSDEQLFARGAVGAAWRRLEGLPTGSRIACFMAAPAGYTHLYPIFGRRFQLVPVPVDADGAPRELLHVTWQRDREPWWSDWKTRRDPVEPAALERNLRAAGVRYALVTRWGMGDWPPQAAALAAAPGASKLFDDGYSQLYELSR